MNMKYLFAFAMLGNERTNELNLRLYFNFWLAEDLSDLFGFLDLEIFPSQILDVPRGRVPPDKNTVRRTFFYTHRNSIYYPL